MRTLTPTPDAPSGAENVRLVTSTARPDRVATVMPVTVPAIMAEGLVKIYRSRKSEVRALDGIDLEVGEGTVARIC